MNMLLLWRMLGVELYISAACTWLNCSHLLQLPIPSSLVLLLTRMYDVGSTPCYTTQSSALLTPLAASQASMFASYQGEVRAGYLWVVERALWGGRAATIFRRL
jgi:hypothetical protein